MSGQQVDSTAASYKCREWPQTPSVTSELGHGSAEDSLTEISAHLPSEENVYLRLVSAEGEEFKVKREHALISGTIRAMLGGPGPGAVGEDDVIYLSEISSRVVQKLCMYFEYKARYPKPPFPVEFVIEPEIALELVMAADFLDC